MTPEAKQVLVWDPDGALGALICVYLRREAGVPCTLVQDEKQWRAQTQESDSTFLAIFCVIGARADSIAARHLDVCMQQAIPAMLIGDARLPQWNTYLDRPLLACWDVDDLPPFWELSSLVMALSAIREQVLVLASPAADQRRRLRLMARQWPVQVFEAASAREAGDILQVNMGGSNMMIVGAGEEDVDWSLNLVRQMRLEHGREGLGILSLADVEHPRQLMQLFNAGADDVLWSFFSEAELAMRMMQVSVRRLRLQQLMQMRIQDTRTRLVSRKLFLEMADRLFHASQRHGIALSLGLLEVDAYYSRPQEYHRYAMDLAVRHMGALLEKNVRANDLVARYGDMEFVILTFGTQGESAEQVFARLQDRLEHSMVSLPDGSSMSLGVRAGVCPQPLDSVGAMLQRARRNLLLH